MKLEVKNPNNIVRDAFIDVPTPLATSLFINTAEQCVRPNATGGLRGGDTMDEEEFQFYPEGWETKKKIGDWEYDSVTLTAETKDECQVLRRLAFELHSKRQLWFMYCDESVYTEETK